MNEPELPESTEPTYALWIRLIGQSSPSWVRYVWEFKTEEEAVETWRKMIKGSKSVIGFCVLQEGQQP